MRGKEIKRLRESKNLSRKQLADLLGCDVRTISKWENDENGIGTMYLGKLAKVLGVSVEELIA